MGQLRTSKALFVLFLATLCSVTQSFSISPHIGALFAGSFQPTHPTLAPTVSKQALSRKQSHSSKFYHWTRLPFSLYPATYTKTQHPASLNKAKFSSLYGRKIVDDEDDDGDDIIDTSIEGEDVEEDPIPVTKNVGSGSSSGSRAGSGGNEVNRQLSPEELEFMEKIGKYIEEQKAIDPNYDPLNDPDLQKKVMPPPGAGGRTSNPFGGAAASSAGVPGDGSEEEDMEKFYAAVADFSAEMKEIFSGMSDEDVAELEEYARNIDPKKEERMRQTMDSEWMKAAIKPAPSPEEEAMSEEEAMDIFRKVLKGDRS
jgi:hypothetical protein